MSLTQAQIEHLGKLTALHPSSNLEISSVLDSFESLGKIDTTKTNMISRSGQGSLVSRQDIVVDSGVADDLLACTHQKRAAHQIVLGWIMVGE